MKKFLLALLIFILLIGLEIIGAFNRWSMTWFGNTVEFVDQKIDDTTNYETIKKVEDTCRAMIASYESDKLTYEQYKISTNEEKQSWAEQAKMRANKTASSYNNYILKNSFVWNGNIPSDIRTKLPYLE